MPVTAWATASTISCWSVTFPAGPGNRDACAAYSFAESSCPATVARQSGLFIYRRGHTRLLTQRGFSEPNPGSGIAFPDSPDPSWSPTGRRIAYVLNGGLYFIRPDGSGRRRIFNRVPVRSIDWSPNGRRLVIEYRARSEDARVIATIRSADEASGG